MRPLLIAICALSGARADRRAAFARIRCGPPGRWWPVLCSDLETMDPLQIKNRLLARRRQLLSRYHDELALMTEELDSREIEDVENASELWDARVLSILGNADAAALGRVTAALHRFHDGNYGTCTECRSAIEPARLFVLPETATCFDCALEAERSQISVRSRIAVGAAG